MEGEVTAQNAAHFRRTIWPLLVPNLHQVRRLFVMANDMSQMQEVSSTLRETPSSMLTLRTLAIGRRQAQID